MELIATVQDLWQGLINIQGGDNLHTSYLQRKFIMSSYS